MTDKEPQKYSKISERHASFRRGGTIKKTPFSMKKVILFFIIISLIVLVAASIIYLF
jgi:hypothetical protein